MTRKLIAAAIMIPPLLLAGCGDGQDARVQELESELAASQAQVAELQRQVEEAEARAMEAETAPEMDAATDTGEMPDAAALEEPLVTAAEALRDTEDQLTRLEDALLTEGFEGASLDPVRENLRTVAESLSTVADRVGANLDTAAQPQ